MSRNKPEKRGDLSPKVRSRVKKYINSPEYKKRKKAEYLARAFPFDYGVRLEMKSIVEKLSGELGFKGYKPAMKKNALSAVLANLVLSRVYKVPLRIGLEQKIYEFRSSKLGYDVFRKQILEKMIEREFIRLYKGYFNFHGESRQSRLAPMEKFDLWLESAIKNFSVSFSKKTDEIVLNKQRKNGAKRRVRLSKHDKLVSLLKGNLSEINSVLMRHRITAEMDAVKGRIPIFPMLHRVFNNDFKHGGRFYTSTKWGYLSLTKDERKTIEIGGEETVEIDFRALHIMMLYAMKRKQYKGYPYDKLNYGHDEKKLIKLALLSILNAKDLRQAIAAINYSLFEDRELYNIYHKLELKKTTQIIDEFKKTFSPISRYFCSGVGIALQNKDSRIAEKVLLHFARKGIPVLPVHDSFIIQQKHEDDLKEVMQESYSLVMRGFTCPVN
jgi:hypothetical protein